MLAKLKSGHDVDEVRDIQEGLRPLNCPGTIRHTVGSDLGLREGSRDVAIVADFVDAASYRGYDADDAHNALRARLAPMVESIVRAQFDVPD